MFTEFIWLTSKYNCGIGMKYCICIQTTKVRKDETGSITILDGGIVGSTMGAGDVCIVT